MDKTEIISAYNQKLAEIGQGVVSIDEGLAAISLLMEGLSATDFGDVMMRINRSPTPRGHQRILDKNWPV